MQNKLKIFIADDHTVVRKGMSRLLKTFKRVVEVQEASNGKELIQLIGKEQPDAVILDVEMPVMGGLDAARYLLEHFPDVKILVLTMHTEDVFISRLMDLGVHGFLSKASGPEEVENALYAIVDKDFYKNNLVDNALHNLKKQPLDPTLEKLSHREVEVLVLICQEHTPGEISARLNISEKTFFNHRSSIIAKTAVRNNIGLYKFALQHGFLA
ncbi:MAG: response regulator transcription factor [Bacteroidota bacterium]